MDKFYSGEDIHEARDSVEPKEAEYNDYNQEDDYLDKSGPSYDEYHNQEVYQHETEGLGVEEGNEESGHFEDFGGEEKFEDGEDKEIREWEDEGVGEEVRVVAEEEKGNLEGVGFEGDG